MPRANRVDPFGDLHVSTARGAFTGNRGCLVDAERRTVRHHHGQLWIVCRLSFRGWRHPLDAPRTWTPLFFLDDAVALAAGHRPCATCRREDYVAYRDAVAAASGDGRRPLAAELDRRLTAERLRAGRGLDRRKDRRTHLAPAADVPDGAVIVDASGGPRLVHGDHTFAFGFGGWREPRPRPLVGDLAVLTPPTSVGALRHGFVPVLDASVHRPIG